MTGMGVTQATTVFTRGTGAVGVNLESDIDGEAAGDNSGSASRSPQTAP